MTEPAPPLIDFARVDMKFGAQQVLRDLSFQVRKGETLVIVGESGCGKTVLLKLIIALLKPTSGRVEFEGRSLAELNEQELTQQRLRFGFLFQGAALFDSLSIFDNIAFGLREQRKISASEIADTVRQRLQEVGLPETVQSKKPAELSGGMKKRAALARALALNPEVMLYDEPTTGLDPVMTENINQLILQTRERHPVTSVIVTHEMRTVFRVADRVVMLHPLSKLAPGEGQILYDGPADQMPACADERVRNFVAGNAEQGGPP